MPLSNQLLEVHTGIIIQADVLLHTYYIRPIKNRIDENRVIKTTIVKATTLNTSIHNLSTVNTTVAYPVGTPVLYVCEQDPLNANSIEIGIILGSIASDIYSDYKTNIKTPTTVDGLDAVTTSLADVHATQYQNNNDLSDFSANGVSDVWAGDYALHGEKTVLLVGNDRLNLEAGVCSIELDAINQRLVEYSLLSSKYTIASAEDTSIVNGSIVYTKKHAGNVLDAYGSVLENDNNKPFYRYVHQMSDILGTRGDYVLSKGGKPLAQQTSRYNGRLDFISTAGVRLAHSSKTSYYDYKGWTLHKDETALKNKLADIYELSDKFAGHDDPFVNALDFIETWGHESVGLVSELDVTIDEKTGEAVDNKIIKIEDNVNGEDIVHDIVQNESYVEVTATGAIVLRDAWGSEIRMYKGNIQISAANTLTLTSGRDTLMLGGGVLSANAVKGIDLGGVNGSILMHAPNVKIAAGDKNTDGVITLDAVSGKTIINAGNRVSITSPDIDVISTTVDDTLSSGHLRLISTTGNIVIGSRHNLSMTANSNIQIACPYSHITMASDITMNSSGGRIVTGGMLYAKTLSTKADVFDTTTGTFTTKSYASSVTGIETNGNIITTGNGAVMAAGPVTTADYVYCNAAFARRVNPDTGVFGSKSKPKRPTPSLKNITSLAGKIKTVCRTLVEIKNKTFSKLLFSFNKETGGCVVYRATNQYMHGSNVTISVATHIDKQGKTSYIYPGESFWTTDGLRVLSREDDFKQSSIRTLVGANQIVVLPSTTKEKEA